MYLPTWPAEFTDRLKAQLGVDWEKFEEALRFPPPVSIRENPKKCPEVTVNAGNRIPWCRTGRYLEKRPSFTSDPHFHGGRYYVQEASSMFLEQALLQSVDLTKALTILDLCAAPGGKSTHAISLASPESLIVSNEVIRSRMPVLAENLQKWGYANVVVTKNDPADFRRLQGFFDVIIVDAPCSGEGLFRKDPEAANAWSAENVKLCSVRQRRILQDVWPALKEGGILIYSTCTFNTEENEKNLQWLLAEYPLDFISLDISETWGIEKSVTGEAIGYRFYPHRLEGEGFFMAVIQKKSAEHEIRRKSGRFTPAPKKIRDEISTWLQSPSDYEFIFRNNQVQFIPKAIMSAVEWLADNLHLHSAGCLAAEVKHDKLIPDHAMALSVALNKERFECLDLELDQALRYLRKEAPEVKTGKKGFSLVAYQENPLGWVNVLDNRINNLYPSSWRIRMAG